MQNDQKIPQKWLGISLKKWEKIDYPQAESWPLP